MTVPEKFPSKVLQDAVDAISTLPGVGQRSALRLAMHLLAQPSENILHFADAVGKLATDVHYCPECMMVCDGGLCPICSDTRRDHSTICIVENIRDVLSIESTGQYRGVYHVLGGIISPIAGVAPSDLNIKELVSRVAAGNVSEVILALSGDVEGETTAFYIYRQIQHTGARVTAIARGLGFSDGLQYADAATLGRSIAARTPFRIQ